MANSTYTFDGIISSGTGYFQKDSTFSASVRRMQTKLNRLGFPCGTADGIFGKDTDTQVRAFQKKYNLNPDGKAGQNTLSKLDSLSPDSTTEKYGRELTHSDWKGGYSTSSISETESLARTIYGEDSTHSTGQAAVAKELYNRKKSTRNFGNYASSNPKSWKGIVFSKSQYAVVTGTEADTGNARHPNQYSSEWENCVDLATKLVKGKVPSSTLGNQCYHLSSNSSYPATSVASTRIQIPSSGGNKFFDYQTAL